MSSLTDDVYPSQYAAAYDHCSRQLIVKVKACLLKMYRKFKCIKSTNRGR
uniref:Uncharacterized protein n=1 Tax=Anguilla anguilla TaxID=7936 RepID=A0A0E9QBS8_ANGAN